MWVHWKMGKLSIAHVVLSLTPGGTERLVIELVRRTREHCRLNRVLPR